ncbi:hypothetical protein [Microbaculum marinum]|uniref:Uncharacterized protein n=1 Tax=Microbaculum marinum TaxID=1764581 RepID=A0AAW9RAB1_9HYPH
MTDLSYPGPAVLRQGRGTLVALALFGLWFAVAVWLGANGAFAAGDGELSPVLPIAVLLPGAAFLAAYATVPAVRNWALALDPAVVVGMQSWRAAGILFVFLWLMGLLPPVFAVPAGFGDFAVGILAMFAAVAVARASVTGLPLALLVLAAGLLDFALAVGTGVLSNPGLMLAPATGPTSQPMSLLPLSLVPTALVPWFLVLHLISWMQIRAGRIG